MRILLFLLALLPVGGFAADAPPVPQARSKGLPPPDLPPRIQNGRPLESTIIIRETDKGKVKEYRINGRAYMVQITPQIGPPYYLIDRDGDGVFETQTNDPRDQPVPMWILFSW